MSGGHVVYRFGDFELDPRTRQLRRRGVRVRLSRTPFDILHLFVRLSPGAASPEAIREAGWGAGNSTRENHRVKVSQIRRALGETTAVRYIETLPNGHYRVVSVEVVPVDPGIGAGGALTQAEFLKALRGLATLTRSGLAAARAACEATLAKTPGYAPALAELAMTYALEFEATRFGANDASLLPRALALAEEVTRDHPKFADGWSILGFVLSLMGETDRAIAAARTACALDADCWEHVIRLSFVCWGRDRVKAAQAALELEPHLALAYWLKITVYIARGAFEMALLHLQKGCELQDEQPDDASNYRPIGLHLLRGLVLAAMGRLDEALAEFDEELKPPSRDLLYEQECRANTKYAIGAIRRRLGDHEGARKAFREALEIAPRHLFSMAALGMTLPTIDPSHPRASDVTIARAIALACAGRHADAAAMYEQALAAGPHPNTGWILMVEPILQALERPKEWRTALSLVQHRAT